ncbi:amino acid adenylation domain-containing protein [Amycolatopsis sp. lyj-112]|uniref:amino acid adenylation domain-containing protein n=1 Tax=Amycolatopsis sp. lyj-112 TaxID=2789288 RepID=UPI00397E5BB5
MSATKAGGTAAHDVPAASTQERMWFAERMEPGDGLYNMPVAFRVHGRLSAEALERAVAVVVERHEILRTSFAERDGRLHQHVEDPWAPAVERVDLRGEPAAEERLSAWLRDFGRRPFDLDHARLFRVGLADLDDRQQVLVVCAHHMVWDGASTRLFLREVEDCYDAVAEPLTEIPRVAEALPLPTLFLGQAAKTPDETAVVFADTSLRYAELDRRARAVAGSLTGRGLGRGDLVGVYLNRSADLVPTLLGVLLSGAAYVPLDPIYPPGRIAGMIEDAEVKLLLTDGPLPAEITATAVETAHVDDVLTGPPVADAAVLTGDDIAYVIYTSGSTGRPKGVRVTHRGLANLLRSMADRPGFGDQDTMLALTTVCFDIAALELFLPLITGGTVEVASAEAARDGELLVRHLERSRPTHVQATPATWRMLLAAGWQGDRGLTVFCGGEALPRTLADDLLPRARAVWNLYGPTETTIWSTASRVTAGPITLGEPVANTTLHVLDEGMRPVPSGEPGELWIGGDGVAAGYLRRPELTAERFREDAAGDVLYRTGDLVRVLPGGHLEYVNRVDNQIKLHGFRIEPGEIESLLRGHSGIADAVVLLDEGDKLTAYLDCAGPPPTAVELRSFLGSDLPEYMIPAAYRVVDAFPLTRNGKVDRNALRAQGGQLPAAPRAELETPTERLVGDVFAAVLQCPAPGADESFFELGGHSLLLARFTAEIAARTGIALSIADVYRLSRPRELAAHLDSVIGDEIAAPIASSTAPGTPASSMQEQMWLAEQMDTTGPAYNIPLTWRITGDLDPDALRAAFAAVIERHEILRSAFQQHGGRLHQVVTEPWIPDIEVTTLGSSVAEEIAALVDKEAETPFDLAAGRPLRARLISTAPAEHVLILCLHHIAFDAQSLPVLQRDLDNAYRGALGLPVDDLPSPVQFSEVAQRQREELGDPDGEDMLGYWAEQLAGAPETTDLGVPPRRPEAHGTVHVPFSADFVARTAELCDEHRTSWYMVAVAAVATWLHGSANHDDVTFGLPVANRRSEDLEDVLGPCLNTVLLRSRTTAGATFADVLSDVRDSMLDAFEYEAAPLPAVLDRLRPRRREGHTPFLDVMLNLVSGRLTGHALGPATATPLPFDRWHHETKFGLTVTFVEEDDKLTAVLTYRGDRHPAARARRLAARLGHVLDRVDALVDRPLTELLPSGRAQFRDFALKQSDERESVGGRADLEQWTTRLSGAPVFPALTPPLLEARPGSVPIPLKPAALDGLRSVRTEHGVSWFMVAATALAALLHRWTGQEDVTFGCPVADRVELPDVLGPCLNTVVLRSQFDEDSSLADLLHAMRDTVLDAFENPSVPFEDIVDRLNPPRRPGWTPYVDVMLAVTAGADEPVTIGGLGLDPIELDHDGAGYAGKFALTVGFEEIGGQLRGTMLYRGDRITGGEARRMAGWLGRLFDSFADVLHQPVRTLDVVDDHERTELRRWEQAAPAGPATTVAALFADQVAERPQAPAVRSGKGVRTYRALDDRAEALAAVLRPHARGARPAVAFLLPRGEDLIVCLLAAWKAGFIPCPLDPVYPAGRIGFILGDLDACAVVTDDPAAAGIPDGVPVIDIATVPVATDQPASALPDPDSTAYVLYTSGSTGEPKGVEYSHRGLAEVTRWHITEFDVRPEDRVSQIHSVAFDTSQHEIWPTLCGGAELVPYERSVVAPELATWLDELEVTMFFVPTPLGEALWAAGAELPALRWMIFAGSPLTQLPPETGYRICDAYGPTETFITTSHLLEPSAATVLNCIGRPTPGVRTYVLDDAGQRCPIGFPGELYVGGSTVAKGYWNREELTQQRFSTHNPDGEPDWVYRTGDQCRWLPDGTLEYLGRGDRQLKIRGYRVEPQEIEAQLHRDPLVAKAVVRGYPGEAAPLVAYLIAADGQPADTQAVLAKLKVQLPEFMVPNAVVWLPELPMNSRGKLATDQLPRPGRDELAGQTPWMAPETDLERRVAAVWSGVLGIESVGAQDNFFDLGGNSLLLATLHTRLRNELEMPLSIRQLFEYPTVHALARALTAGEPATTSTVDVRRRAERAQRARRARPVRPERNEDVA